MEQDNPGWVSRRVLAGLVAVAMLIIVLSLSGCDAECTGHGGWYTLSHGVFYCNDGTLDYG